MIILCITQFLLELHKVYLDQDRMELWYNNLLQTSGPQTQKLEAEGLFFNFVPCTDVYGHFHIPTQISDLLSPSWKEKWFANKQTNKFETNNSERICEAFLTLHLT